MENTLAQIQDAIDRADIEQARFLLRYELQKQPSLEIYLLAARVAVDDQQRKMFLEKVIQLDPFHQEAHREIRRIEGKTQLAVRSPQPPTNITPQPLLAQQHNIHVNVNQQAPTVIFTNKKSVFLAFILTLFFGPLGMFYSTTGGALIMIVATLLFGAISAGAAVPIMWIISIVWGMVAAASSK